MKITPEAQENMLERYDYLLGKTLDGVVVTEKIILSALNRIISARRKRKNIQDRYSDLYILDKFVTEKDVLTNIKSVGKFINANPLANDNSKQQKMKPQQTREIDLSLDNFDDYKPSEREFIKERMKHYMEISDEELTPNDKFTLHQIILLELSISKLNKLALDDPEDSKGYINKIEKQMTLHQKLCDGLGFLRKQRIKNEPPKDGGGIYDTLEEVDAFSILNEEEEFMKEAQKKYKKKIM